MIKIKTDAGAIRFLAGKTIERVDVRPFPTDRMPGEMSSDPVIWFEDGSRIAFVVDETEIGEYGISVLYFGRRS